MDSNLIRWSIDRKHTDAHRKSVITHMKAKHHNDMSVIKVLLPPIFFRPIDDLSDDEVRLLDNFTHIFFKGEEVGNSIF